MRKDKKFFLLIAIIFSTAVLSLAGFPPLIGFYVKFNVFLSVIESTMYFAAIVSILCSVISTFYYLRLIKVLCFETGTVGNLYFPVNYLYSLILGFCFYFLIGLSIFSYVLSTFSVGQAMMFIIFKMKSDDDNILDRLDQDEIKDDDDKNLNIEDLIVEEKPESSDSSKLEIDED